MLNRSVPRRREPTGAYRGAALLAAGFAGLIGIGTLLLMLPISTVSGQIPSISTALFTSTSAVCVTGLVVVDTGSYWSTFGQGVIYFLIQLGGIGFGSAATFLFWLLGRNISLQDRLSLSELFPGTAAHRIARTALFIVAISLGIQAIGATIMFAQWAGRLAFGDALFFAIFHSASAFCNAGFDLFGSVGFPNASLIPERHSPLIMLPIVVLILLGGLGFPVLAEILSPQRLWRFQGRLTGRRVLAQKRLVPTLSLHARLVIFAHLGLFVVGALLFWLLEARNPRTLGGQEFGNGVIDAVSLAAQPRTAGYASLPLFGLEPSSLLVIVVLMFVGGGSASTAGGVKVNTVATLFASVVATLRGRPRPQLFRRTLTQESVNKALAVVMIFPSIIILATFLLTITEQNIAVEYLLFEVVSAFSTVGLTLDVTPRLSEWGRIIVELLMFVGRLGPLTLVILLSAREHATSVNYAEEPVLVG